MYTPINQSPINYDIDSMVSARGICDTADSILGIYLVVYYEAWSLKIIRQIIQIKSKS